MGLGLTQKPHADAMLSVRRCGPEVPPSLPVTARWLERPGWRVREMCGSAWMFRERAGSLLLAPARPPSPGGQLLVLAISLYPLHGARLPVDLSTDLLTGSPLVPLKICFQGMPVG